MEANTDRPAYVQFEYRVVEDREASIAQGSYVGKDVAYAMITPQGSKDKIERVAKEWLDQLSEHVANGRMPATWAEAYKSVYRAWEEGRELPENGTPILTWPPLSPSQVKTILDANIRTVEDLANSNEAAINSIGMGARGLVQQAKAWLDTVKDVGVAAAELAALRAENANLLARSESTDQQLKDLAAQIKALEKVK